MAPFCCLRDVVGFALSHFLLFPVRIEIQQDAIVFITVQVAHAIVFGGSFTNHAIALVFLAINI